MLEETRARRKRLKERRGKQFGSGCVAVIKDVPSRLRVTKEKTEQIHVLKEPERRWTSDTRTKKSIGNRGSPVNRSAKRIWVDVSTKALATFPLPSLRTGKFEKWPAPFFVSSSIFVSDSFVAGVSFHLRQHRHFQTRSLLPVNGTHTIDALWRSWESSMHLRE